MDVIIDANIIRKDLKIRGRYFEILLDYIEKTNSRIILPTIVIQEVEGLYKRALKQKYINAQTALEKLKSTVVSVDLPELQEIDIDKEAKNYIKFLYKNLGISSKNLVKYKNKYLPDLVSRAINRVKPLNENGQQFRDGILWLTVLDFADSLEEKRVAFISDNPKDFAEGKQDKLDNQLQKEAEKRGLEINFYRSVENFAKQHASTINFITAEWMKLNIDMSKVEKLFHEFAELALSEDIIENIEFESNEYKTGDFNQLDYINSRLVDYYVYEKSDKTILLNIDYEFELEYEIEIEREVERNRSQYDYAYNLNPLTGEREMKLISIPNYSTEYEHDHKYHCPVLIGKFVLTIVNEKIKNYELEDWDLG